MDWTIQFKGVWKCWNIKKPIFWLIWKSVSRWCCGPNWLSYGISKRRKSQFLCSGILLQCSWLLCAKHIFNRISITCFPRRFFVCEFFTFLLFVCWLNHYESSDFFWDKKVRKGCTAVLGLQRNEIRISNFGFMVFSQSLDDEGHMQVMRWGYHISRDCYWRTWF